MRNDFDYSGINSVWQSSTTDHVFEKYDQTDYLRILNAILSVGTDVSSYLYRIDGPDSFHHPLTLAQGMKKLNLEIGYIFADDPSVVVWPLGKDAATAKGNVIVHCTRNCADSNAWRYKALHTRKSEDVVLSRRRVVGKPSSKIMAQQQSELALRMDDLISPLFGPRDKETSFFDLPAEIRNVIYTECVRNPCTDFDARYMEYCCTEHEHCGDVKSPYLKALDPNALCRTSRRIKDEVLPLLLASKSLKVDLSTVSRNKKHTWSFVDTQILTTFNKWLGHPSNTAYLRSVEFRAWLGARQSHGARVELTNISPGYNLTSAGGIHWEPENFPGCHHLPALLRVIISDKETIGLSIADVACIAEFLWENYECFEP